MPSPARPTLVHTLVTHAATRGEQTAYEYLHDDGRVDSLTYRELLARAVKAAARLRADSGNKGPALLLYPPGLDFVVAVWACFLAGVPAVPAYPPIFGSTDRIAARFTRMLEDSRAGHPAGRPGRPRTVHRRHEPRGHAARPHPRRRRR